MSLTVKLLLLCLLSMSMLMGVLVLVVARGERKSLALRLWGWGLVVYALGMLFIVAEIWLPLDFAQIVGNGLISVSALLTSRGVLMHVPQPPSLKFAAAGFTATVAVLVLNHLLRGQLVIDIAAPTVYATLLYIMVSWRLLRHPPPAARAASNFLATAIVLTVLVWDLRLALIMVFSGPHTDYDRIFALQAWFAVFQMLLVVCATLGLMWVETRLMEDDLRRSAFTDILTGLPNRRAMLVRFREETARAARQKQKFGVALFDIDNFKQINDTCGHYVGDAVLQHIGDALSGAKRAEDALGRIGGEEFLVILPHHERDQSIVAAERLRLAVMDTQPQHDMEVPAATVSGGVAIYPDDGEDWDRLFMAADRRLYRAKRGGRNRVEGQDE
ncbi:MAG TPA: GGDEF domain-containing protein [Gammaproteobacteria bacterium]|nr:GGDEF domain-containing protein [Gammaproteobacteria bacterium]